MDTVTYPSDLVKKFLEPLVVMYVNPTAGKENQKLGAQFDVNSYPRLVVVTPKGDTLIEIKGGLTSPEDFVGGLVNGWWNLYVDAQNAKPQNVPVMAKNVWLLTTWFPHCEAGRKAAETKKQFESNAEFKAVWEPLQKAHECEMLAAKADAELKLGKKKEAIETYKALLAGHEGTKEAENAAKTLKKLGVKLDAPPAEKK
ncbi:MAG: hypothetical protein FD180_2992 [Planctomycetota bacterium]|nr:MAG: hypothetical protein FD180_2992 [Planctomycetota bacterium]